MIKKRDSTKWKSEFRISKSNFPSCNLVIATLWQSVWLQNHFVFSFFSLFSILSIDVSLAGALSVRLHEGLRRLVPLRPLQGDQVPGDNLTIWQSLSCFPKTNRAHITSCCPKNIINRVWPSCNKHPSINPSTGFSAKFLQIRVYRLIRFVEQANHSLLVFSQGWVGGNIVLGEYISREKRRRMRTQAVKT